MADYCWNKVTFSGAGQQQAIENFGQMGYDAPPFHSLIVEEDCVYFESPWMPPYQDLSEIAERFDVSFKLEFRLAGERQKQNYAYTCIRDEKLQPTANELREQILSASNHHELSHLEGRIHELGDQGKINLHERQILALLVGRQLSSEAGNTPPWFNEEPENQRRNGR